MTWVAVGVGVAGAAASAYSANKQSKAAQNAANAQVAASDRANQLTAEQTAPWREAGTMALSELTSPQGLNAMTRSFTLDDFQADPGYQFRYNQGLEALQRGSAARGMLNSGNTLQALVDYGQGMGAQEYQSAYNRFGQNQSKLSNYLQSLAGLGQTSANQYAESAGQNIVNAGIAQGNAGMAGAGYQGAALQSMANLVGNVAGNPQVRQSMSNWFSPQQQIQTDDVYGPKQYGGYGPSPYGF